MLSEGKAFSPGAVDVAALRLESGVALAPANSNGLLHGAFAAMTDIFELGAVGGNRWLPMEGLRGLAICLVFLVHYVAMMTPFLSEAVSHSHWLPMLEEVGHAGVDLFFVLSGLLIYMACMRRPFSLQRYAWHRIRRIYPTFLVVLALYIAILLVSPTGDRLIGSPLEKIRYLVANALLLPGLFDIKPIITVAWSLSYEAFYYIVTPLLVLGLGLASVKARDRLILVGLIYGVMVLFEALGNAVHFRLSMFLVGIVIYEVAYNIRSQVQPANWPVLAGVASLVLGVAALVASDFTLSGHWLVAGTPLAVLPVFTKYILLNLLFGLLVYAAVFTNGVSSQVFSWTPLRWLGNMSYSYYLFHAFALHMLAPLVHISHADRLPGAVLVLGGIIPAFAWSVVVSVPLFVFVEKRWSLTKRGVVSVGRVGGSYVAE